jgi:hypothetical protein
MAVKGYRIKQRHWPPSRYCTNSPADNSDSRVAAHVQMPSRKSYAATSVTAIGMTVISKERDRQSHFVSGAKVLCSVYFVSFGSLGH